MTIKVYYIENDHFDENWLRIKFGFLIKIFEKNGMKCATIREPVDKIRKHHFHNIYLENVRVFEEDKDNEVDFLNDMISRVHTRMEDIWDDLEKVKEVEGV